MAANDLISALKEERHVPAVLPLFRALLATARDVFNEVYSPRVLVRLDTDALPSHPRHVSAIRGRMGTLIEAGVAGIWNEFIKAGRFPTWRVTVNYVTEYPDLHLRDPDGDERLRIEAKTLHDEADEGAARFDALTPMINESLDVLVIAGWRWESWRGAKRSLLYPVVFVVDAMSAREVAHERDHRFKITGGVFKSGGRPYVQSKKARNMLVADPGNYGKLKRIIHRSRRDAPLHEDLQRLGRLLLEIYPRARARDRRE